MKETRNAKRVGWSRRANVVRIGFTALALVFLVQTSTSATTFTVTNLNDSGTGSLREAITNANSNPGSDTIVFTVAGMINILTQLPDLSDTSGAIVDGSTAPGYLGSPVVVLSNGTSVGVGIQITSSNNEVRCLQIISFSTGIAITGRHTSANVIAGNFIGTDGTSTMPNSTGISITNAPDNIIGGTTAQARNVISGNQTGIGIYGIGSYSSYATRTIIQGNLIGTDATGSVALGNTGRGVHVDVGRYQTIGGTTPGRGTSSRLT